MQSSVLPLIIAQHPFENFIMLIKLFVILALVLILGSLFSALFYLAKDKGQGDRTVKALTVRISLSIALFILLLVGYQFKLIGHNL